MSTSGPAGAVPGAYPWTFLPLGATRLPASSQVRNPGSNLSGFQDPKLDDLLEAARKPAAQPDRVAAWKALLAGIGARIPMLPLAWGEESMFVDGVEGITPTLIGDTGDRYWDVLAWRLAADR